MTPYAPIGVWIIAQVTFTELIHATADLDVSSRRHGWNGVMFGAAVAIMDFGFLGISLFGLTNYVPQALLPTVSVFLLFFAGAYLANRSYVELNSERSRPGPSPFRPRIRSLPITRDGFARGFWGLMEAGVGILAVWLAIAIAVGWQSATLGALLGVTAILFLMLQTKQVGLSRGAKPSSFYSFAAGGVMGYAVYCFSLVNFVHH